MLRLLAIVSVVVMLCLGSAESVIPPHINYQGVLTGPGGEAVPDGDYDMTFKFYDTQTAETHYWETTKIVTVTKGIFNAPIGPLHFPLENIIWLGITIEDGDELSPRTPILASAYALNSRSVVDSAITTNKIANQAVTREKIMDGQVVTMLNGIAGDMAIDEGDNISIVQEGQNLVISATGGGGGVSGSGAAGQLAIWDGPASVTGHDWLYWDSINRRLGVGTAEPNGRLRVESDEQFAGVFASTHESDTTEVIRANYLGGGEVNAIAIKGISLPSAGFGIGGHFTGGYIGLSALGDDHNEAGECFGIRATVTGGPTNYYGRYAIRGDAMGPNIGGSYGVLGSATGSSPWKYGVYGGASGDGEEIRYGVYGYVSGGGPMGNYAICGDASYASGLAYAGYFDGDLAHTGSLINLSDRKFKTNLRPCEGALDKVLALQPKKYSYDTVSFEGRVALPEGEHYGLVAQEVEEVFPELVSDVIHPSSPPEDPGGEAEEPISYKGIKYIEMIPLLVQAIKEQQLTIEQLKSEIEELKKR